uniref:Secreted protein n=1 Tax=Streptomyces sp. NBC_00008 TaxID=2903610 RepID=A0AAU2VPY7_9ACTN
MMRQHMKLTVVLVAVVLALTGFSSSSHGHGSKSGSKSRKSSSSGSSGGGCSNSKKSNGTYHDTDSDSSYDDDDYSSGSSSTDSAYDTATPTATATDAPRAYVFRCAAPRKGKRKAVTSSTVRLTANAAGSHTYEVDVSFLDARGTTIDTGEATVDADAGDTKTVSVRMDSPSKVSRVKKCSVTAELTY